MLRYQHSIAGFLLLLDCIPRFANGISTIKPEVNEVMIGQSTYFNCSTSIYEKNTDWYFYAVGATGLERNLVFFSGKLKKPYDTKVRVDYNISTGVCNLIILSATLEDAGRYVCQDDGGIGEQTEAQLVVIAADPACDSNMTIKSVVGPNSCGIDPEDLELSCTVAYNGNIPPVMQWKSSANNESLAQNVTSRIVGNIVTYNLTMKVDLWISGSFFFCETTRSTSSQYNCSSPVIDVLYVFSENSTVNRSVGDELECSAKRSNDLVCDYKWKWFEDEDSVTKSRTSTLKPTEPGWHRCEATCVIKKRPCNIHVVRAYVFTSETDTGSSSSSPAAVAVTIVVVVVVVVLLLLIGLIVAVLIRIRVRNRRRHRTIEETGIEMNLFNIINGVEVNRATQQERVSLMQIPDVNGDEAREVYDLNTTCLGLLGGKQKSTLETNRKVLVDLIDPSKLLHSLYSAGLIKEYQKDEISSRPSVFEKVQMLVEMLLEILIQGRHKDYQKAMNCLRNTGHSNVADVLEGGEVVIRVHIQMCDYESSGKISEIEDMVVKSLTKYIQPEMYDLEFKDIRRILETTRIKIIAARHGDSVVLYVALAMMEELSNLEAELESGNLRNAIELLYKILNPFPVKITVKLQLQKGDLKDATDFFQNKSRLNIPKGTASPIATTNVDEEQPKEVSENDQIKRRVLDNFPAFVSDVDPDKLCDHLIAKQIITTERWNMIRAKGTQQQRCRELLLYLDSITNPRTFLVVRDALETICPHLHEQIEHQSDTDRGSDSQVRVPSFSGGQEQQ